MRVICAAAVFFLGLAAPVAVSAVTVEEVPNPRDRGESVSDMADLLSDETETKINSQIAEFEVDERVEVLVVTIDALPDRSPLDFAIELFNYWGPDARDRQHRVLALVVGRPPRVKFVSGYGLEDALSPWWLNRMTNRVMNRHLFDKNYDTALLEGLETLMRQVRRINRGDPAITFPTLAEPDFGPPMAPEVIRTTTPRGTNPGDSDGFPVWWWWSMVGAAGIWFGGVKFFGRRQRRQ